MNLNKITCFFIIIFIIYSCDLLYQNDFVKSEKIYEIEQGELFYDLYQTGIDNYRYEFNAIKNQDTVKLFDAYLNDAIAKNSLFTIESRNGFININCNKPLGEIEKVAFGMTFKLKGRK